MNEHPLPFGDAHDEVLLAGIRRALGAKVTRLDRIPLAPRVERLTLWLTAQNPQHCVIKYAGAREVSLYRTLLEPEFTGAPSLLGFLVKRSWLFLEWLPDTFIDLADPVQTTLAYRHLGAIHRHFAGKAVVVPPGSPWAITQGEIAHTLRAFPDSAHLADEGATILTAGPYTLVQGDYHRWNLLLHQGRIRVLDWEHAGVAHPIWDLVLLTPDEPSTETTLGGAQAEKMLSIYHEAGPLAYLDWERFRRLHRLARLFVAARWNLRHERVASTLAPGLPADVVRAHAAQERERMDRLISQLQ